MKAARAKARWSRITLLVGVLCAALAAALSPSFERSELATHDLRFRLRGARDTGTRLVIAEIADSTLAEWTEPMVFWGARYAAALAQARQAGVEWIGFDLVHPNSADAYLQQSHRVPVEELPDRRFALALRDSRVVLASVGSYGPAPALVYSRPGQGEDVGFADRVPELDEVVRHGAVYRRVGDRLYPSFAAALALRARGRSPVDESALVELAKAGSRSPDSGAVWINYVGRPGSFPTLPVERLASGALSTREREQLRGAILLVGASYGGSNDVHRGPAGSYYTGTEIQGHALATLVDRRPLRRGEPVQEALLTLGIGMALAFAAVRVPVAAGLLITLGLAAAWCGIAVLAFRSDVLLPVAGPLLALGLVWVGESVVRAGEDARRRREVETLFGQHVSRAVVDRLLDDPAAGLEGVRREVTVLFADIRDFTAMAEPLPPEEVVRLLNEFLGAMNACVARTGGTVDKYIGDAVMAFWNAPEEQPDHAHRALTAAREMLETAARLDRHWRAEGRPQLRIAIGINSGEVMAGVLGSDSRRSYTVIGAAVNLASRIERANRELETELLIGEETYRHLDGTVPCRTHQVRVDGVANPVTLYEPVMEERTRDAEAVPTSR